MTRKKRRAVVIVLGLALIGVASTLVLSALQTQVTFFMSPAEVAKAAPDSGTRFRLGGLVAAGSFKRQADAVNAFTVTDNAASLPVTYKGILPDLFREGQGVVAEGRMVNGVFVADTVLAKHDENYMPPEVAAALKKNGHWQEQSGKQAQTPGT